MRILLVTETLAIGGAETFAVRLANELSIAGHQLVLADLNPEKAASNVLGSIRPQVRLEALRLPVKSWWWKASTVLRRLGVDWSPLYYVQRLWLGKLLEQFKPQIVHSHLLKADILTSRALHDAENRAAHVITLHGDYAPYWEGQADPQLLHLQSRLNSVVKNADALVGVCKEHVDFISRLNPGNSHKLHLIYNGYADLPEMGPSRTSLGLPADEFLFGMVSRGVTQKGWDDAIAAFRMLDRPDAALVLVGEGPAIAALRRGGVPPGVFLAGLSDNPTDYIRHFDVCLLPTRFAHESLPTVVIEYLFCAKPVIATRVGEIPNMLLSDEGTMAGRLLDFDGTRIDAGQLCDFMRELMDDSRLRADFSAAARSAARKFDMDLCRDRYIQLYEALLTSAADKPAKAVPIISPATSR